MSAGRDSGETRRPCGTLIVIDGIVGLGRACEILNRASFDRDAGAAALSADEIGI
jgi:hypothetical protein